jgi:hypothetical protein
LTGRSRRVPETRERTRISLVEWMVPTYSTRCRMGPVRTGEVRTAKGAGSVGLGEEGRQEGRVRRRRRRTKSM